MPDGKIVGDDEGNFLSIAAMQGDSVKINKLADAVRYYGITEGRARFLAGHRKISDDEYEEQKQRMEFGLIPDPYDAPAYRDELRGRQKNG
jgi:hypothetical protein